METIPRVVPKGLRRLLALLALLGLGGTLAAESPPMGLSWKDREWTVTQGGPLGLQTTGQISASPENVSVDSEGGLHLRIGGEEGHFTGAEVMSREALGFGTYTWDLEGPVDVLEPQVVFGLLLDGPFAGIGSSGENAILIELTRWSSEVPGNNLSFTVFPPEGYGDPSRYPSHEYTFSVDLKGLNKLRVVMIWSPTKVTLKLLNTKNKVTQEESFVPEIPEETLPHTSLPVGFRLWTYRIPPTEPVDVVVRNFTFVPAP